MAGEIRKAATLTATKTGMPSLNISVSKTQDMTGVQIVYSSQLIGTTWEAVTFGDISGVPSQALFQNLDSTNYIELALANDDSQVFAKIVAGDLALIPLKSATLYAKANSASCNMLKGATEA